MILIIIIFNNITNIVYNKCFINVIFTTFLTDFKVMHTISIFIFCQNSCSVKIKVVIVSLIDIVIFSFFSSFSFFLNTCSQYYYQHL